MISVRLGLQQRVMPDYRVPFFEALAVTCPEGLCVFAGMPRRGESVESRVSLQNARFVRAGNIHILWGPLYFCWQSGLIHWLENWQPQVLILEANPRYLHTPVAVRWMHARRRKVIGWGLGMPSAHGLWGDLYDRYRRSFIRQLDAVVAYSQQGAEEYRAAGLSPQRVFVATNAIAPRPTYPYPERPLNLEDGRPVVLFIGRLQARKRVDLLLRASAALPPGRQPRLWIVGDGPARNELEHLSQQIYPQAEFFGDRRGMALESLLLKTDLFVLPGTGGLAVQQAMSYGLPVVVAEADGTQSDLVSPENGWRIPPGDVTALRNTLEQALADIPRLRQMGRISYNKVAKEINLENMVQTFGLAVNTVLESGR